MRSTSRLPLVLSVALLSACASPGAVPGMSGDDASSLALTQPGAASPYAWAEISYGIPQTKNQIAVLDPATRQIVRKFDLNFSGGGVAGGPKLDHLFVPLAQPVSNTIVRIDAPNFSRHWIKLPESESIAALAIGPDGGFVYAGTQTHTYKVNASTGAVAVTGSTPIVSQSSLHPAVVSRRGLIYNADGSHITVLNAHSLAVAARFSVTSHPLSVALSNDGASLYALGWTSGSQSAVDFVSTKSDTVLQTVALSGFPYDVAVDSSLQRLYATTDAKELFVVDASTGKLVRTIATSSPANSLSVDPLTHDVWFVDASGVRRLDYATGSLKTYSAPPLNLSVGVALAY